MTGLLQDVRFALRQLRKSPGYSCVAVLILALGIGGVTAMFSTLYTVMIRPLQYPRPDRLVLGRATFGGEINPWVAGPDYVDYRDKNHSFAALEAFSAMPFDVTTTTGQIAERNKSVNVSVGLFSALGVQMAWGRPFAAEEGRDGAPSVAIVSHAFWQKHFVSLSDAARPSLVVDGTPYDVVGVTPPDFKFIQEADIWFPLQPRLLGPRRYNNWLILGRLKDGISLAEAQSDIDVIGSQLQQAYPDTNANKALLLTRLQGAFVEQYRSSFRLLCCGVAAVLLIAWANAAGLLLARGAARQGELAMRATMGASHGRLLRLLLCEALIIATAAGGAGAVLAIWLQQTLLRLMPIEAVLLGGIGLSGPVLLFVIAATILTGLGFGLLPAWRTGSVNLAQALRSGGRGTLRHGIGLRSGLVVGQVAASFVLLVIAGLLMRSSFLLRSSAPGFQSRNLLTVEIPLPPTKYSDPQRTLFFDSLLDQVRSLPGVVSAAAISQLPLRDPYNNVGIYSADAPPTNEREEGDGYQRVVLPGYFKTMGIPILAGRDIQPVDTADSRPVVVIGQQLAKSLFPNRNPLGQKVVIDRDKRVTWEVVGVVGDVKQSELREETYSRGTFYRSHAQQSLSTMRLAVRTTGDPNSIVNSLRTLLRKMDSDVPLSGPRSMDEVMANSAISDSARAVCLAAFASLAVVLAAVGLYGLLAYLVVQRTGEFGVRLAIGAQQSHVVTLVLRECIKTVLPGIGFGFIGAAVAARFMASELYGVRSFDSATFIGVALLMVSISVLACWLPAHRAAKVDPMVALRYE